MSKDNYMEVISTDGRKKRSKDTSELIIDTAFSLLNEGILNITHELIAKEAKIGTRTIFRHFKDKNSLIIGMHDKLLKDFELSKPKIDLDIDVITRLKSLIEFTCNTYEKYQYVHHWTVKNLWYSKDVRMNIVEWNKRSSNYIFEFLPEIKDQQWEKEDFIVNTLSFPFWQRLVGISKRTNKEIKSILFVNLKNYF
jgi:AcrR family transcriptional regulator|tara:strand:- start:274 stop:861 length:588 start_codon:yes stop_codon:yes gene_type:complete